MTLDEIASFCQFKECQVRLGDPQVGFLEIDGSGVKRPFNAFRRYLAHHELAALPDPATVLAKASKFSLLCGGEERVLDREDFRREMERFCRQVGL